MKILIITTLFLLPNIAFAWGGRGHNAICQAAVFLVKEDGLKKFLQTRPHVMGYLCNVPDVDWKSLAKNITRLGNPTHYINPEALGLTPQDVPLDFSLIEKNYEKKQNKFKNDGSILKNIPQVLGTDWWRADQFMRRISSLKKDFEKAKYPKSFKEDQNENLLYNKTVFEMMLDLGLMGHFVGDDSQPFHVTADHDGFSAGHGGIHSYYEEACVSEFDGDLQSLILKAARSMQNIDFLKKKTALEKMQALGILSFDDIPKILKLDPVIKPSYGHKKAVRKSAHIGFENFKDLIVIDLARGALLTANLWDEAYRLAGRPNLSMYRSYKYPYRVDFVPPDYITPTK